MNSPIINFEFKARAANLDELEKKLLALAPKFIGEDHQIDTYFKVNKGRLKIREGTIENALIYYERKDLKTSKQSDVLLHKLTPGNLLKEILTKSLGIKTIVDKKRKIYFIDNVKFHFDTVLNLGTFVEVEAIDTTGKISTIDLKEQCDYYFNFFKLKEEDYVHTSYSDLLLQQTSK